MYISEQERINTKFLSSKKKVVSKCFTVKYNW